MPSPTLSPAPPAGLMLRRIRGTQHWRAVGQILRDYPLGADAIVDHARSANTVVRFSFRNLLGPLYFAREQGWMVRGPRGEIAAMMYLRRQDHAGVRVMHVDDLNVNERYLRRGLARGLLGLAEELARRERRPYLKLAVTVANTPAVTLYRRLGYQVQHHRYFRFAPSSATSHVLASRDVTLHLRRLSRSDAAQAFQRFYRIEMAATAPAVADLMVAYYAQGGSDISGLKTAHRAYAIEGDGEIIGYGDGYRQKAQWHLRLGLRPEFWATDVERQAIQLMGDVLGRADDSTILFHVPSAGHYDALCAGPTSLACAMGLSEHGAARMIMVKPVARAS
jgi:ribosomal protein S18 acetylase RimI-like enzyme